MKLCYIGRVPTSWWRRTVQTRAAQQWQNPRLHATHAPAPRRSTKRTRSSERWGCETTAGAHPWTPMWRRSRPPRAAPQRSPRRRPAVCRPSAPHGGTGTAMGRAGAPSNTPSPPPATGRCTQRGTLPRGRPCAMGWRNGGSKMRPLAAA